MSDPSNSKRAGNQIKLRRRLDVPVPNKPQLIKKPAFGNTQRQNPFRQATVRNLRKLNLSNQDLFYCRYLRSVERDKLLKSKQDVGGANTSRLPIMRPATLFCNNHKIQMDSAKLDISQLKIQNPRLCVRKNQEMLGSYLNPISFSIELKYRKKWPDPPHERPAWEELRWKLPKVSLINYVSSSTEKSSQIVFEYAKSVKDLYDLLINCKCSKMKKEYVEEEHLHQNSSTDLQYKQRESNEQVVEVTDLTSFSDNIKDYFMDEETQVLQNHSVCESLTQVRCDDKMILDLDKQTSKSSTLHNYYRIPVEAKLQLTENEIEISETLHSSPSSNDANRQVHTNIPFLNCFSIGKSNTPVLNLCPNSKQQDVLEDFHTTDKVPPECDESYSSSLMFLKGDETMVATALSEGKVVLHSIEDNDMSESCTTWDKDETITLYSGDPTIETNKTPIKSQQNAIPSPIKSPARSVTSSECSTSSCSSTFSPHNSSPASSSSTSMNEDDSSTSEITKCDTCSTVEQSSSPCFVHSTSITDINLHQAMEETRKSFKELIVSTLVLHSLLSDKHQRKIAEELIHN